MSNEPLTHGGENFGTEWRPILAESWETSEDGLEWTLQSARRRKPGRMVKLLPLMMFSTGRRLFRVLIPPTPIGAVIASSWAIPRIPSKRSMITLSK